VVRSSSDGCWGRALLLEIIIMSTREKKQIRKWRRM
jgi:hypothetical protein